MCTDYGCCNLHSEENGVGPDSRQVPERVLKINTLTLNLLGLVLSTQQIGINSTYGAEHTARIVTIHYVTGLKIGGILIANATMFSHLLTGILMW